MALNSSMRRGAAFVWIFLLVLFPTLPAAPQAVPTHGLWVWKGPMVLETAQSVGSLRDFCRREAINEIYVSVSERDQMMTESGMSRLIDALHRGIFELRH